MALIAGLSMLHRNETGKQILYGQLFLVDLPKYEMKGYMSFMFSFSGARTMFKISMTWRRYKKQTTNTMPVFLIDTRDSTVSVSNIIK